MNILTTLPLTITITHYSPSNPGQPYGPPEHCEPPTDLELEFETHTLTGAPLSESDFGPDLWAELTLEVLATLQGQLEDEKSEAEGFFLQEE